MDPSSSPTVSRTFTANASFRLHTADFTLPGNNPQLKPKKSKVIFKKILDEVLDKKNWEAKWRKIKAFVNKKRNKGGYQTSHRDQVFNTLLALYAGDDEDEVFSELARLYEKHPDEFEFYVPQLCTYLFHFNNYQPRGSAIHPSANQGS